MNELNVWKTPENAVAVLKAADYTHSSKMDTTACLFHLLSNHIWFGFDKKIQSSS